MLGNVLDERNLRIYFEAGFNVENNIYLYSLSKLKWKHGNLNNINIKLNPFSDMLFSSVDVKGTI